jgi:hypothetical protein
MVHIRLDFRILVGQQWGMKLSCVGVLVLGGCMHSFAQTSAHIEMEYVTVGDPSNPPDSSGFGAVDYTFQIGKFEVTQSQYTTFLNAVDPRGENALKLYNDEPGTEAWTGISADATAPVGSKYTVLPAFASKPVTL